MPSTESTVTYEVTVAETNYLVTVEEPTHTVTVNETDQTQVQIAVSGIMASPTAHLIAWNAPGALAVKTGEGKFYFPVRATLVGVSAVLENGPTGDSFIIDLNKNGTSVWTDQSKRPEILEGSTVSGEVTDIDLPTIEVGDQLSVDIDQVGSTWPGDDLTVTVRYALL